MTYLLIYLFTYLLIPISHLKKKKKKVVKEKKEKICRPPANSAF